MYLAVHLCIAAFLYAGNVCSDLHKPPLSLVIPFPLGLLDPRWKEQRDKQEDAKRNQEDALGKQ